MIKGTIYNSTTGRIINTMQAGEEAHLALQVEGKADQAYILGVELDSRTWYVKDGVPTERASMGLIFEPRNPDEEEELILEVGELLRISNIPVGTRLIAPGGTDIIVDDGFIEWSTDHAGLYGFWLIAGADTEEVHFNAVVG